MKQNFLDYIKETFDMPEEEYFEFEKALERPLKKSIRINTNKISVEDLFALAKEKEWTLTPSNF
jgi:16S rRNA C967 or C1407 C5-methylase (RsmB/RsmF family)